jgi:hypothetical protein
VSDTLMTIYGQTMTLRQWAKRNKTSVNLIRYRLSRGIDPARAVDPRPLPRGGVRVKKPVAQTVAPELTLLRKVVSVEMVQSKEIGMIARQHREAAGRTLREVAGIMQIDQSYLSDLERGQREWHSGLITRWNVAAKELFTTDAR